jgi:hypothetical protein
VASLWYDATITGAADSICTLLDGGFLEIWSGSQPALNGGLTGTKLAKLALGNPFETSNAASGGVVTVIATAITASSALVSGTAGYFALLKSDDATVVATGTVGLSGADLSFSSLSIISGAVVSCSSLTITVAETGT